MAAVNKSRININRVCLKDGIFLRRLIHSNYLFFCPVKSCLEWVTLLFFLLFWFYYFPGSIQFQVYHIQLIQTSIYEIGKSMWKKLMNLPKSSNSCGMQCMCVCGCMYFTFFFLLVVIDGDIVFDIEKFGAVSTGNFWKVPVCLL
jgi:hypothetical protein